MKFFFSSVKCESNEMSVNTDSTDTGEQPLASKVQNIRIILDKNVPKDCFYKIHKTTHWKRFVCCASLWSCQLVIWSHYTCILHKYITPVVFRSGDKSGCACVHVCSDFPLLLFPLKCPNMIHFKHVHLSASTFIWHFTVSLEGTILCFVSHHFSSKFTVGHNR